MDEIEDDARFPAKSHALNRYGPSNRQKIQSRNVRQPQKISNRHDEEEDDELDNFVDENDQEDDEEEDDYEGQNGYGRSLEYEGDLERHPKKRKLRNSVSNYEFVPRTQQPSLKLPSGGRNAVPEWTEHATFVLLEVWGDRFLQLGRKSLRSEDWREVSEKVSESSKTEITEMQCRTMLDKLKRKYKKEKAKAEEIGLNSSRWPYFKKMDMLMASSSRKECGLACGVDSGEFVFMNTRVYLDRSNGFDEMRDSPGESETSEEENDSDGFPPRGRKIGEIEEENSSLRVLADSIQKFGEIYEKIESGKRQQMMELEKMRMDFHRELELQKKQILERAQAEIEKMQDDDEEDDSDASEENLSG